MVTMLLSTCKSHVQLWNIACKNHVQRRNIDSQILTNRIVVDSIASGAILSMNKTTVYNQAPLVGCCYGFCFG